MSTSLNRLIKAFKKFNLSVSLEAGVYRVCHLENTAIPPVEILLPEKGILEGKAVKQLVAFAGVSHPAGGQVETAIATPDFHAGTLVPVGAVVSTTNDIIIPQAIGTDIHCGMRLHVSDVSFEQWETGRQTLIEKLRGDLLLGTRNLPMKVSGFHALFTAGLADWIAATRVSPQGDLKAACFNQLEKELPSIFSCGGAKGNIRFAPDALTNTRREILRDSSLATIGGGNHFVEFQVVEDVIDRGQAFRWGIKRGQLAVMIHTGSRAVGMHVGSYWNDRARAAWPTDVKFPASGIFPLHGELAREYLTAMNTAANYANLNRLLLAEIVRCRMRQIFDSNLEMPLVYDAPHNMVSEEGNRFVHRKGATPAHAGQPVLIPGSMGHPSYLMKGLGNENFQNSASHGAGRARSRHDMFCRNKAGKDLGLGCVNCISLKEDRVVEEAPEAYKNIEEVIDVQVEKKMVQPVARLRPLLTFKG